MCYISLQHGPYVTNGSHPYHNIFFLSFHPCFKSLKKEGTKRANVGIRISVKSSESIKLVFFIVFRRKGYREAFVSNVSATE